MALVRSAIDEVREGRSVIIGLVGEAGIGKTRLARESRNLAEAFGIRWLEGQTTSPGQTTSYWPFREMLRSWAGIHNDDTSLAAWAKLTFVARELFPYDSQEILPYLAVLLGIDVPAEIAERSRYLEGEAMGRQVLRSAWRLFDQLAHQRPTVLAFEDIHWLDESSALLLEHLFPLTLSAPLLICLLSRPGGASASEKLLSTAAIQFGDRYRKIVLGPLTLDESGRLIDEILPLEDTSAPLRDLILRKAEGNPFFLEEIARAVIDTKGVVWDGAARRWRGIVPINDITIPDTVQAVIAARLDRLDDELKQVLKTATVIGRNFLYRVLLAIQQTGEHLDLQLSKLEQLELIREQHRTAELEYTFQHALTQEAAYETILARQRRELHDHVAISTEELFADRVEDFCGLLAYHYARAENWPKAHEYLLKAGDQAGRMAAETEALGHYRQAITAYEHAFGRQWDPAERAELERKMGEAMFARGGAPAGARRVPPDP